jgi:hypothetical protein
MDYKILRNKNIVNYKGEKCYDLLSKTFNKDINPRGTLIIVNKHYVARPDLISLALYNEDTYADIICKVNGISNPFEINENDYLFIPSLDYIRECILTNSSSADDFINTDDDEILNKKSNYQKKLNEKRSPNEQVVGEKSFVIDKSLGVIFY